MTTQVRSQQRTFPLGQGYVVCDLADGAPVRVEHPAHPGMTFLLDQHDADWHHLPFRWGKGFLISDAASARWDMPTYSMVFGNGFDLWYEPLPGLTLAVERRFGATWYERYTFTNQRDGPLTIGSLAISTPFRDVYHAAESSLNGNCHAHIWTGGNYSYVCAVPMRGTAPVLGLALRQGALWAYSIESRNPYPGSHNRGHIYLHASDAARAPQAHGGQPLIVLRPGESLILAWDIGWHNDAAAFEQAFPAPFVLPSLAAELGTPLLIQTRANMQLEAPEHVAIARNSETSYTISSTIAGVAHLDLVAGEQRTRAAVLFHQPVRTLVERRVRFILDHQRAATRDENRRGAFLPYDNRWRLVVNGANWLDWSDARERIAMPRLIQQTRQRGWMDSAELDAALADFDRFARAHLVDDLGNVFEHSFDRSPRRLYNFPWLADFYLAQFDLYQRFVDLDLACRIIERYYALGGARFLAISHAEVAERAIDRLHAHGDSQRAETIGHLLIAHANYFLGLRTEIPSHEVNYEQSIVAPLLMLLLVAQRMQPTAARAAALYERLRWLTAFAGQQPHVRLRHVAIRHWDGYWFGAFRQWGDTFPHYWSVLSAAAFARFATQLGDPGGKLMIMAEAIFSANFAHFHIDGTATCAFVFPSCVDGNPAYHEDPLANDQDWALVYYLR